MNKTGLLFFVLMGVSLFGFARPLLNPDSNYKAKAQLVIAINNTTDVGTDAGTTLFPNTGVNSVPTKDVGTDTHSEQTPADTNYRGPPRTYPTAPPYAPAPSTESGGGE